MTIDPNNGWTIPGRYEGPAINIAACINHEVAIRFTDRDEPVFYNSFDLLEVALAAAWSNDPTETTEILTRSRIKGFSNPRIGTSS